MRFRSQSRRKQARQETADRAAAKLIYQFMTDQRTRYLTYRLSFFERCQFNSLGDDGMDMARIELRTQRFEERVARALRAEGIHFESSLDIDIQPRLLNPSTPRLRSCVLTVQRA